METLGWGLQRRKRQHKILSADRVVALCGETRIREAGGFSKLFDNGVVALSHKG